MIKVNLNTHIKVKLTPLAEDYLRQRHEEIYGKFAEEVEFRMPEVDENGYCNYQLWEFIGIFGDSMKYPSFKLPIKTDIYIEENK